VNHDRGHISCHVRTTHFHWQISGKKDKASMITLENVHKRFGQNHVLRGVDATVKDGEVVCIVGPSGSGKSTILGCINGLETYEEGAIHIEEKIVDRQSNHL